MKSLGILTFQVDETLNRMDDDRDRECYQKDSVEKGRQNLGSLPTIGQHVSLRTFGNPNGIEGDDKGQDVAVKKKVSVVSDEHSEVTRERSSTCLRR
jgi:hypothetical protein